VTVELLWWEGCPSTEKALDQLRSTLSAEGLDPEAVQVREVSTQEEAEQERFPGSPTIRIDGADAIEPNGAPVGLTCRVYRLRDGRPSPTPDPEDLREAVRRAAA